MAALGRLCVHRSDVLGALSRAEVDSQPRLRGLALEGVRGLDESRARTSLERTARPARNEQPRLGWRRGSVSTWSTGPTANKQPVLLPVLAQI